MKNKSRCLLCNAPEIQEKGVIKGIFQLVKCQRCQFLFVLPRPTFRDLELAYCDFYTTTEIVNPKQAKRISEGFHKIIKNYAPEAKRILEIGCSTGYLLYGLRQYGYEVCGTDISLNAVRFAENHYGLKVFHSEFPPSNLCESFDVLILSHIVEHVIDPQSFVDKAGDFLKKEGILIIAAPNADSFGSKVFNTYYPPFNPPFHLSFFNKKTLSSLLKNEYDLLEIGSNSEGPMKRNPFFYNFLGAMSEIIKGKAKGKNQPRLFSGKKSIPQKETAYFIFRNIFLRLRLYLRKVIQFLFSPPFFIFDKMGMGENIVLVGKKLG